ncbi:MAG TPA: hypothetical protein VIE64_02580 [Solirubrobacterales bacterium]
MLAATALFSSLALGEVGQSGTVRVSVSGDLSPTKLPRKGAAPIAVSVGGKISSTDKRKGPPQLKEMSIAINRNGHLDTRGLSRCRMGKIDPSTSQEAIATCRSSLIGEGSFSADVKLPEQSPFPSEGKVLAFNGRLNGHPAVLAHIYGKRPLPTAIVLPFVITGTKGTFGTLLTASLPQVTGDWGYVTGLSMTLERQFTHKGKSRSYLSAGCPAPAGFRQVSFPFARTSFVFEGGRTVTTTLTRRCRVK